MASSCAAILSAIAGRPDIALNKSVWSEPAPLGSGLPLLTSTFDDLRLVPDVKFERHELIRIPPWRRVVLNSHESASPYFYVKPRICVKYNLIASSLPTNADIQLWSNCMEAIGRLCPRMMLTRTCGFCASGSIDWMRTREPSVSVSCQAPRFIGVDAGKRLSSPCFGATLITLAFSLQWTASVIQWQGCGNA